MKKFTESELAAFDGKNGHPVYVAYQSKVFDVSGSNLWKGGLHMNRHRAGNDLTTDLSAAPHSTEMLDRYPQVGVLEKESSAEKQSSRERSVPMPLAHALDRFPILRRHPHPMVVHFPIVFSFSTVAFTLLYLLSGVKSFQTTAAHCLAGGILFTPVAMLTGWFTWWYNYQARPLKPVTIKIWFSFVLFFLQVILFIWSLLRPGILESWNLMTIIYLLLLALFVPVVTIVGWFGATMTFPVEK